MKTKGEIEAEISQAIVQFEIDYMGRGPKKRAPISSKTWLSFASKAF